jgi:septum formation protein
VSQPPRLVLASASPARLALLRAAGIEPEVVVSGVDEDAVEAALGDPGTEALVAALARAKAEAVAATVTGDALVVGCDSLLELDGRGLGKPHDPAEATARWRAMRGRTGVLHTGHHLIAVGGGEVGGGELGGGNVGSAEAHGVGSTRVHFADITDDEIAAYVANGEPLHVAGAFTIDGRGAAFVERIEGDHGNVIGLSLPLLRTLVGQLGVRWTDLWT